MRKMGAARPKTAKFKLPNGMGDTQHLMPLRIRYSNIFEFKFGPKPAPPRLNVANLDRRANRLRQHSGDGFFPSMDRRQHPILGDRKSTRLNSSHVSISYA